MRYLIELSYNGSTFYGFQKQKDENTIQGQLEDCISKLLNCNTKVTGCSRTDRGVHAYSFYAHFDTSKVLDINKFVYSLNKIIDKNIYIKKMKKVSSDFSSRYDVKMKEYVYKINVGEYNPLEKDYVFQYNKNLNINLMKKACKYIKGTHNFKSFSSDNERDNYERTIKTIKINKKDNYVYIIVMSPSFLRYMVRIIVGLLIEISEKKKKISDIENIFNSKDRKLNAKTAHCEGLYLNKIWY